MDGVAVGGANPLTLSIRKRALFQPDSAALRRLLEEDDDLDLDLDLDLGISRIEYDSASSSDECRHRPDPTTATPNTWRMNTRSRQRRTPLPFEAERGRRIIFPEKKSAKPSGSSSSVNFDAESCSDSLQDLTFDTDSENDSKNNRVLRSSGKSSKTSTPRSDPAACGMKTPRDGIRVDGPPPRHHHHHGRRALQVLSDRTSPPDDQISQKRKLDDAAEALSLPPSKFSRKDGIPAPKARHSLFASEAFKRFISPKSFYAKSDANTVEISRNPLRESDRISPNAIQKSSHPHVARHPKPHRISRKNAGEINKGVKHGIRRPKHLKKSRMDVLKMAMEIIENSPLNAYINGVMKKEGVSEEKLVSEDPSAISENQLKKMDVVLRKLGCQSSIYKLFKSKTFDEVVPTRDSSVESETEEDVPKKDCANNKFFKSSRKSFEKRKITVDLPNRMKVLFDKGKISLVKKRSKTYHDDSASNAIGFDASDLMDDDDDDLCDSNDKENIDNLISQWEEEEIPLTEPQANRDFVEVMRDIGESELLIRKPSGEESANESAITEVENFQLVPTEDGAYLVVEDVEMCGEDEEEELDLDKIESELQDLDRKIKMMAEMNNINPESLLVSPTSASPASETTRESQEKPAELFPIFVKKQQNSIIENENKSSNSKTTTKKPQFCSDLNQQVLDCGQKRFGATQCTECGLIYQPGEAEDERYHKMHHLSLDVLKFNGWKNEKICGQWPDGGRCIVISPGDPASHWNRVNQLLNEVVNPQLGFAVSTLNKDNSNKAYLYIEKKMIVGCAIVEPRNSANKLLTAEGVDYCSTSTVPVKCGVSRIWTHSGHRQKGVATRMMKCVRSSFLYGDTLDIQDIAFSSPTPLGKLFIEKFTKCSDFPIYLQ